MIKIAGYFWQICLLRASPSQLPGNPAVLGTVLGVYCVTALLALTVTRTSHTPLSILGIVAVGVLVQGSLVFGLLAFKRLGQRFYATWSALLGANTIMLIILLPINLIISEGDAGNLRLIADSISWVCLGWWFAIGGYIFHKATEISILQGAAIAFMMELLGVLATVALFPPNTAV